MPYFFIFNINLCFYIADRGHDYYMENKVVYVEIDGEISNLKCSCSCSGACKHEFVAMLQLKESFELITENYEDE